MIHSPKVFLVDDDPFYGLLYEKMLRQLGVQDITIYQDGQELINALTLHPEIVFLDYNMQNMDGLEVLKKIKRINPDVYVVFISGQESLTVAVDALKYGAFDYIIKGEGDQEKIAAVLEKIKTVRTKLSEDRKNKKGNSGFFGRIKSVLFMIAVVITAVGFNGCTAQHLFNKNESLSTLVVGDTAWFKNDPNYEYSIRQDDKITISVWNHDDLSVGSLYGIYNSNEVYGKWLMVDAAGNIPVPHIGVVNVGGLTIRQAKDTLVKRYSALVVNPVLEVKVLNKDVTVLGEVKTPGNYLLEKENNSLVELIGRAGDFEFYADRKHIQVLRMADGLQRKITVNLTGRDQKFETNIQLHPHDIVVIPSRRGKMWDKKSGSVIPVASVISALALVFNFFR
ncbi:MAG: response regulator [Bacteroidota bacterium]|jgi:polysaccharide export outer membrane protein